MNSEKEVKNIVLEYTDGTKEVIEKGLVARFTEHEGGGATASFDMTGMSGKDLFMVVAAVIQLGSKIGFFNEGGEDSNV